MSSNKAKSSSTTNTTNVSGQNAISGDNLGTAISGVNGSEINVNMTQTDHGAIEAASKTSQQAMDSIVAGYKGAGNLVADVSKDAFRFGESALSANQHVVDESLSMVGGAVRDVTDLAGDVTKTAMEENRKANEAAMAAAARAQAAAMSMASKAQSEAFSFSSKAQSAAFDFGDDALSANESISNTALEKMRENASDTVDLANDMAAQSAQTTKEVIGLSETFAGVTEKTISQSQTGASDSMMKLGVATAIALSVAIAVRG